MAAKTFFCVDAHTCGNPVRVVAGGSPILEGKNMFERRLHFMRDYDWIRRGLMFELFRPGNVEVKDYYAELPITLRVSGRYHDFGAFAADVSNLSRIVTLHNLAIGAPGRDSAGALSLEATARTYRYLDAAEVAEQQKKAAAA